MIDPMVEPLGVMCLLTGSRKRHRTACVLFLPGSVIQDYEEIHQKEILDMGPSTAGLDTSKGPMPWEEIKSRGLFQMKTDITKRRHEARLAHGWGKDIFRHFGTMGAIYCIHICRTRCHWVIVNCPRCGNSIVVLCRISSFLGDWMLWSIQGWSVIVPQFTFKWFSKTN